VLALQSFQSFLFLLGSFFVPLFAVLLADWLASGRHYGPEDVFGREPVRVGLVCAWIAGFVAYQWLSPTGPAWWVEQVQRLDLPAWGVGATLPSFVVSFGLALGVSAATGRVGAGAARA
jgi:NCS1 family nucleobase:cation symporter-1